MSPNPARGPATIAFELGAEAGRGEAELLCYDLGGRLVRRMSRALAGAGRYQWTWDGADARGRAVLPGLYFLELRAGGFTARGRVLAVR